MSFGLTREQNNNRVGMKTESTLSCFLRERRHRGPPRRLFFLRQGFFLEEECVRAFRNLGLTVQEFQVGENWNGDLVSRLLTGLVDFLPDFKNVGQVE